jgi:triosephosphate isomerase
MNNIIIVANFKSHMNESEAKLWIDELSKHVDRIKGFTNKQIIIAPPFTLLPLFKSALGEGGFTISSQNISPFDAGAFTGEVYGGQIRDFANYAIIGHSERRSNFKETDAVLEDKVELALRYGLKPIYCVQDKDNNIPQGVVIVAYEPVFAIGSGNPDTPENAEKVCRHLIGRNNNYIVLYGGSVTSDNVASFTKGGILSGVLVGGASLNPSEFIRIIENA